MTHTPNEVSVCKSGEVGCKKRSPSDSISTVSFSISLDVDIVYPHSRLEDYWSSPKFHLNPLVFTLTLDPNLTIPQPFLLISEEIVISCLTLGLM